MVVRVRVGCAPQVAHEGWCVMEMIERRVDGRKPSFLCANAQESCGVL